MQREHCPIAIGESRHRLGERRDHCAEQRPGDETAEQALECSLPEEGPADVAVGCAQQAAHLDLRALGKQLEADGVEGHDHQRGGEQEGQQHDGLPTELQHRVQALDPGRVQLHVGDFGPAGEGFAQIVEEDRVLTLWHDHEGIRQRVARQIVDDVGEPAFGQLLERFVARHEALRSYARVVVETSGDLVARCAVGLFVHEYADFRAARCLTECSPGIVEEQEPAGRQGQCDADDQCSEKAAERVAAELARGTAQCEEVFAEPGHAGSCAFSRP